MGKRAQIERSQELFGSCGLAGWSKAGDSRNVSDDGCGSFEARKQGIECRVVIAFRKPSILFGHNERNVGVRGMRETEQVLQMYLLGRGTEQVDATDDRVDALLGIVHHYCQLIRERPIGSADEEISALMFEVLLVRSLQEIDERYVFIGDDESVRWRASRRALVLFLECQCTTGARINGLFSMMRRGGGVQVCSRAETGVHQATSGKFVVSRLIGLRAIMLEERTVVPGKSQGLEVTLHCIDEFGFRAICV